MLERTKVAMKNGQSRDTGNINGQFRDTGNIEDKGLRTKRIKTTLTLPQTKHRQ